MGQWCRAHRHWTGARPARGVKPQAARPLCLVRTHRQRHSVATLPIRSREAMARVAGPAFVARADDVGAIRQAAQDHPPPPSVRSAQCYRCAASPQPEEPDARMGHVRICGSRGRVTARGHPAIPAPASANTCLRGNDGLPRNPLLVLSESNSGSFDLRNDRVLVPRSVGIRSLSAADSADTP